jgi:hypothetical protein
VGFSRIRCFRTRHFLGGRAQAMSLFVFATCLQGLGQCPEALTKVNHDLQVLSGGGGNKRPDHLERA